jgi:ubiquitin-protein ligase
MTTGQVWGPGIYFSDDLGFSFGYARSDIGKYAIGVFEVKKPNTEQQKILDEYDSKHHTHKTTDDEFNDDIRTAYRRTTNIFVVPFEENVRLKYLVVIPNMGNLQSFSSLLIKYFITRLHAANQSLTKMNVLSVKRITKERKAITDLIPEIEIKDMISTGGKLTWMCKYKTVEFAIKFPVDYPISAPSIEYAANHPNIYNGNVCMDILYNWKINNKLDYVVLTFIHEILLSCETIPESKTIETSTDKFKAYLAKKMASVSLNEQSASIPKSEEWLDIKNSLEMIRYL